MCSSMKNMYEKIKEIQIGVQGVYCLERGCELVIRFVWYKPLYPGKSELFGAHYLGARVEVLQEKIKEL